MGEIFIELAKARESYPNIKLYQATKYEEK